MLTGADHYKVLQVDPEAESEVVRAAFRSLAQKYHPDVSGGSQERMAALNGAWTVLRNPEARAAYDRARAEAPSRPAAPAAQAAAETEAAAAMRAPVPTPPPGKPSGRVLDFGRYAGWSLGEIARYDPEFLEWLARTPIGRPYHAEIDALLSSRTRATTVVAEQKRPRRFRRR
jgi:curved DNA-binding protein CbpA